MNLPGLKYKIVVCGKGLPAGMQELKEYTDKNIIYAGFAGSHRMYYKAADVFLNSVLSGGESKPRWWNQLHMVPL